MDTIEQMLSMLLNGAVETLDISPHLQDLAVGRYQEVGTWIADNGGPRWSIYPQGSFRLGTVVRPTASSGEYDIDLVCQHGIAKESTTQPQLKETVGEVLHGYLEWKEATCAPDGPNACQPRRRCWTLSYPDYGFHLDVLPAIPDDKQPPTGILLTDVHLRLWEHSDPIRYAAWFRTRSEELQVKLSKVAAMRNVNVADVPEWHVRSTLQRLVQVLKWHCMLRFADDCDNRPPSILITTLAARAYRGEQDLFTATQNAVSRMPEFIENRHGVWWVPNPAHEEENFADKWNDYPERRIKFFGWFHEITTVLDDLAQMSGKGLDAIAARMSETFAADPIRRSVVRYGRQLRKQRETGALRMGSTGLITVPSGIKVPDHTFHGHHADPRG